MTEREELIEYLRKAANNLHPWFRNRFANLPIWAQELCAEAADALEKPTEVDKS